MISKNIFSFIILILFCIHTFDAADLKKDPNSKSLTLRSYYVFKPVVKGRVNLVLTKTNKEYQLSVKAVNSKGNDINFQYDLKDLNKIQTALNYYKNKWKPSSKRLTSDIKDKNKYLFVNKNAAFTFCHTDSSRVFFFGIKNNLCAIFIDDDLDSLIKFFNFK